MKTTSIHDFPQITNVIDVPKLGCVMLPVAPFNVFDGRGELLAASDLYRSPDPAKYWINGDVARDGGHTTLLYGILTNLLTEMRPATLEVPAGYHTAIVDRRVVDQLLDTWDRPTHLYSAGVEIFGSPYPDEPYACIVARIADEDGALADAHARLSYLPHVDTHPEYKPHVTLAYVKADRAQDWADILNLDTLIFETGAELDYGKELAS